MRVTLRPGDTLVVPSFWWLHETVLSDSISLIVISTDKRRVAAMGTLSSLPVPLASIGDYPGLAGYMAALVAALAPAPPGTFKRVSVRCRFTFHVLLCLVFTYVSGQQNCVINVTYSLGEE